MERARSADINELSPAEIDVVLRIGERVARGRLERHRGNVENAQRQPGAGGTPDFFVVQEPPKWAPPKPASGITVTRVK